LPKMEAHAYTFKRTLYFYIYKTYSKHDKILDLGYNSILK
jgi:hypothetical protein